MRNLRQVLWGIAVAIVSIGLVLGGFSLSLAEGNMVALTSTPEATITSTWQPFTPPPPSPTPLPPTETATFPPPPTNCLPPAGWVPYLVQPGDTLEGLAQTYEVTESDLSQANCLLSTSLLPGAVVYVPPIPTRTPVPCGAPHGWIIYIVRPGDTLYHLSQAYGITVGDLQRANCMGSTTVLHVGQKLTVPPWATRTPSPTSTGPATATDTPTPTPTTPAPVPPTSTSTATPTDTATPYPTNTATESPTATPTPSPTATTS
jgi:LysM repeat protein